VKKSSLQSSCWKAAGVERRPLRLERGKGCKALPIATITIPALEYMLKEVYANLLDLRIHTYLHRDLRMCLNGWSASDNANVCNS
jgi:hypothetical protein